MFAVLTRSVVERGLGVQAGETYRVVDFDKASWRTLTAITCDGRDPKVPPANFESGSVSGT